jgi:hypothetical protein
LPSVRLCSGQSLKAAQEGAILVFAEGQDGLELTTDNSIEGLELHADPHRRVILNDIGVDELGTISLRDLHVTGVVQIIARDKVRSGHVVVENLDIVQADASSFTPRPKGYGVEVLQGALTVWNQHGDEAVTITADITGVGAGQRDHPVRGSGVFVAGGGDDGGRLLVKRLHTDNIFTNGGIVEGTPNEISGGVFVSSGAVVDEVLNKGTVTTWGPNDMVLDNWGSVGEWTAERAVTSFGPSGIGLVNFGTMKSFVARAWIETFGQGARGFNVYAGTVERADFYRITTHGDGAVGVQISMPVGDIVVRNGIETHGTKGPSLVKGVVVELSPTALSIKPGGAVRSLVVHGGLVTHGQDCMPIEIGGSIGSLEISGGLSAS